MTRTDVRDVAPAERGLGRKIKSMKVVLAKVQVTKDLRFPGQSDDDQQSAPDETLVRAQPATCPPQVSPFETVGSFVGSNLLAREWPVQLFISLAHGRILDLMAPPCWTAPAAQSQLRRRRCTSCYRQVRSRSRWGRIPRPAGMPSAAQAA